MKVLIVSTSEQAGGGAIAAARLKDALTGEGVDVKMMVRDKQTGSASTVKVGNILPKAVERLAILPLCGFSWRRMWTADTACVGIDITGTREYKEADVIHLHWICHGMVSLHTLEKIARSGKRVVWTLHDEWAFRGVCHYKGDCTETECRQCPVMCGRTPARLLKRKLRLYGDSHITFVGCSRWITGEAQRCLKGMDVRHVNNCVPHSIFRPIPQAEARRKLSIPLEKKIVMFCSQKITDERKGMRYLDDILQLFPDVHIIRIGKGGRYVSDPHEMALLYSAADVFVSPSLQDNLPNTIAEAMSCGTPCVGFDTGGIPEMINHLHTGYVARYKDADDLAAGIRFVLAHDMREEAASQARLAYDGHQTAQQYISIYKG